MKLIKSKFYCRRMKSRRKWTHFSALEEIERLKMSINTFYETLLTFSKPTHLLSDSELLIIAISSGVKNHYELLEEQTEVILYLQWRIEDMQRFLNKKDSSDADMV